jgi:phage terminase small subunit
VNRKQTLFVSEYLIDHNAKQAAIRAGYSPDSAEVNGPRLLRNAAVAESLRVEQAKRLASNGLTADRILEEMRRLALVDHRGFFDDAGNLKPISELTAEQGACIASTEVIQRNLTAGDGQVDTIHKLKTWDKVRALEMLGKHFALLTEKSSLTGELTVKWEGE